MEVFAIYTDFYSEGASYFNFALRNALNAFITLCFAYDGNKFKLEIAYSFANSRMAIGDNQ